MYREKLEPSAIDAFDLLEPASGGPQQQDSRLVLQGVANVPVGIALQLLAQEHVQVFHHQQDAFPLLVRKIHQLREGPFAKPSFVPFIQQLVVGLAPPLLLCLVREIEECFQPEFTRRTHRIGLFAKHHGVPFRSQLLFPPGLRRHPPHQCRFATAPGADNQLMLIGGPGRIPENFENQLKICVAHNERADQFVFGAKSRGLYFIAPEDIYLPSLSAIGRYEKPRWRFHQSFSSLETNTYPSPSFRR